MSEHNPLETIETELGKGMELPKCRQCGCMNDVLETLETALPELPYEATARLRERIGVPIVIQPLR